MKSRGAQLVTELGGATYDAVVDAAALQEAVLPAIARAGRACVSSSTWRSRAR